MIVYSHLYDLLVKLVLITLIATILILLSPSLWIQGMVLQWGLKPSQAEFVFLIFLFVVVALPMFAWVYVPLLSPAATWCYLRFSLKTPVTWEIARAVESLFRPTLKRLQWYPMKELKSLPVEARLSELLRIFHHLQTQEQ